MNEVIELTEEERERAYRERADAHHARLRTEFEQTCRNKDDDDLPWLVGYIADEIAYHDFKTVKYPESSRYLVMAREVVGTELARRGLADASRLERVRVA